MGAAGIRAIAGGASLAIVLGVAACQAPVTGPQVARQDFADHCAACHGADARGNGPAAQGLAVQPPDLTTLSARNGGSFPLVEVMSQIDGYSRGGTMPEFGAYLLEDRQVLVETAPGVQTPAPERLVLMARYLQSLQR
ncbi:cytochrome C [Meridianimarinicoccus roseus]|uniref:Cytochrome C n=1 Tax=Meridianimarinicoccus roseus TaxID=2072018 RepID=A0A2V2LDU2_9RHOB|nr:c-type cytochrome [Meridianimarinicoccus roseus]PWR03708.1 cytochrome C [Meridianimarinicoccus roseus]